jgi:hypothetical protein
VSRRLSVVVKHPIHHLQSLRFYRSRSLVKYNIFELLNFSAVISKFPSIGWLFFLTRQNAACQNTNQRLVRLKSHHSNRRATSQNIIITDQLKFSNVSYYNTIRVSGISSLRQYIKHDSCTWVPNEWHSSEQKQQNLISTKAYIFTFTELLRQK